MKKPRPPWHRILNHQERVRARAAWIHGRLNEAWHDPSVPDDIFFDLQLQNDDVSYFAITSAIGQRLRRSGIELAFAELDRLIGGDVKLRREFTLRLKGTPGRRRQKGDPRASELAPLDKLRLARAFEDEAKIRTHLRRFRLADEDREAITSIAAARRAISPAMMNTHRQQRSRDLAGYWTPSKGTWTPPK
jgi:hypothetical protein